MNSVRIPATILTGFLGSGKTTLLNRILKEQHGKRIAVIENEFGEVGVDNELVIQTDEEIFEMNNGCVCCTVRGDLIRILGTLAKRKNKFDYVLIETTGLADPGPVAQTFFMDDEIKSQYALDGIVTLVDAKHVMQHLDSSPEVREQIGFADVILLNKVDLVQAEEVAQLERRIREMNAVAHCHRTTKGDVALDKILGIGAFDLKRILASEPEFLDAEVHHHHAADVSSVGIRSQGAVDPERFNTWIRKVLTYQGKDIFRSKGVLHFSGKAERFVFQGVHMLFDVNRDRPWQEGEAHNVLVFIGRNLDRKSLEEGFRACLK